MLSLLVLAAALAVVWRFGYWPFDRSRSYLPTYHACCQRKAGPPPAGKTGA